jgi:hypothetical protein
MLKTRKVLQDLEGVEDFDANYVNFEYFKWLEEELIKRWIF